MFYANIILSKKDVEMKSGTAENMVNMAVVEVCNTEQFIRRLQTYQEKISQMDDSTHKERGVVIEKKEDYFECLKRRVITSALWVNMQAKAGNIKRNHLDYGAVLAWAQVIQDLGHKITIPVWEDENGCLRIAFIETDGEKIALEG